MKKLILFWLLLLSILPFGLAQSQKAVPPQGKTLMFIGQDITSVFNYAQSGHFPTPSGIVSYMPLPECFGLWTDYNWGAGTINTLHAAQNYPNSLLSIGVYLKEDQQQPKRLTKITKGKFDQEIQNFARFISTKCRYKDSAGDLVQYPVYIRLGYEFDGHWNGYDPQKYINAYRHLVDLVRPIASNAVFVWQAATSPIDVILDAANNNTNEAIQDWYPGDEYVDWMGFSWFLSQDSMQVVQTNKLIDFAKEKSKPVMLCESTPQGYDLAEQTKRFISPIYDGTAGTGQVKKTSEQIWEEWFVPYFNYIHEHSDVIRAVCYINADWDAQFLWSKGHTSAQAPHGYAEGYWGDTRLENNPYLIQKWNEEMAKPIWLHGSPSLFQKLQK